MAVVGCFQTEIRYCWISVQYSIIFNRHTLVEGHVKFIWRPKSDRRDLNSAFGGELNHWNNGILINMDRSSFAFANQLKSEKFSENLTDSRIDSQPIQEPITPAYWKDQKRVNLIEVTQIRSFSTKKTPKTIHFEILRLLSKWRMSHINSSYQYAITYNFQRPSCRFGITLL